jgi:hypothetical protein
MAACPRAWSRLDGFMLHDVPSEERARELAAAFHAALYGDLQPLARAVPVSGPDRWPRVRRRLIVGASAPLPGVNRPSKTSRAGHWARRLLSRVRRDLPAGGLGARCG